MEQQAQPTTLVGLYATLAQAEEALNRLQDAGLPYPRIRLSARIEAPELGTGLPECVWVLTVICADDADWLLQQLRQSQPLALGWQSDLPAERDDVVRGQRAWGHYVFESPAATDQGTDSAGTSGVTGVINSGAFAQHAHIERDPPERT